MSSEAVGSLTVEEPGPLTTVQDRGRLGLAALGIGRAGACDAGAYALANRLVGNPAGAATLEVTFGGLRLRAGTDLVVAFTGARCPGVPHAAVTTVRRGATLALGPPESGLRTYVGVRGGIVVPEVLGSRSTDVLAGLGPQPLTAGQELPVGPAPRDFPNTDVAPVSDPPTGEMTVRLRPGPRDSWLTEDGWQALLSQGYEVTSDSNRVGIRLEGATLERSRSDELASEGMARGAVQVPPSGKPVLFLADHPVTGGYPVVAYVVGDDLDRCAQLRPGQTLRFRREGRGA